METLTNSRAKDFRRCARLHHLKFVEGLRGVEDAAALRFGTLMHLGLEVWWSARRVDEPSIGPALVAMREAFGTHEDITLVQAEELMLGYHARWAGDVYQVLGVEAEFRAPLRNPETGAASKTFELAGKLDAIVREPSTGRTLIVEHKTSSEDIGAGSAYWQRLRMDSQVSTYFAGAEALGLPADSCLYDVIGKPKLRLASIPLVEDGAKVVLDSSGQRVRTKDGKKWRETGDAAAGYVLQTRTETLDEYRERLRADITANPDAYYQRGEVVRLDDELREHAADIWQTASTMRDMLRLKLAPRNPDQCFAWNRPCVFFDACTGAASLDDPARFVRVDNLHPELAATSVA